MRRSLTLLLFSSLGALLTFAISQLVWEHKAAYYFGNGYDVPVLLWLLCFGLPFMFVLGIGVVVRSRLDFVAAWLGVTVFSWVGSLVGSPSLTSVVPEVVLAGVGTAMFLALGWFFQRLWYKVAKRRLTIA